jgi:hypothetical protein
LGAVKTLDAQSLVYVLGLPLPLRSKAASKGPKLKVVGNLEVLQLFLVISISAIHWLAAGGLVDAK